MLNNIHKQIKEESTRNYSFANNNLHNKCRIKANSTHDSIDPRTIEFYNPYSNKSNKRFNTIDCSAYVKKPQKISLYVTDVIINHNKMRVEMHRDANEMKAITITVAEGSGKKHDICFSCMKLIS